MQRISAPPRLVAVLVVALLATPIGAAYAQEAPRALTGRSTVWVVARADGSVVRSSGLVSLRREAEGRYQARFDQDVGRCAYTATLGDPGDVAILGRPASLSFLNPPAPAAASASPSTPLR